LSGGGVNEKERRNEYYPLNMINIRYVFIYGHQNQSHQTLFEKEKRKK
jgi:hypothetical protein